MTSRHGRALRIRRPRRTYRPASFGGTGPNAKIVRIQTRFGLEEEAVELFGPVARSVVHISAANKISSANQAASIHPNIGIARHSVLTRLESLNLVDTKRVRPPK